MVVICVLKSSNHSNSVANSEKSDASRKSQGQILKKKNENKPPPPSGMSKKEVPRAQPVEAVKLIFSKHDLYRASLLCRSHP